MQSSIYIVIYIYLYIPTPDLDIFSGRDPLKFIGCLYKYFYVSFFFCFFFFLFFPLLASDKETIP